MMTSMTTEVFGLPHGRPLTYADLQAMPADGHRYELLDGVLIVSPAPKIRHQDVVLTLGSLLKASCPPRMKASVAPVDVVLSEDTVIQPDVIVAVRSAFTEDCVRGAPVLAVEVLSPSTRGIDLVLKKQKLADAGCEHYWVVDPAIPSIVAWRLGRDGYAKVAAVAGDDPISLETPFPLSFAPAELVD